MFSTFTVNCCDGSVYSVKCFNISDEGLRLYCRGGVGRAKIIGAVFVIIILSMDIALQCLCSPGATDIRLPQFTSVMYGREALCELIPIL